MVTVQGNWVAAQRLGLSRPGPRERKGNEGGIVPTPHPSLFFFRSRRWADGRQADAQAQDCQRKLNSQKEGEGTQDRLELV